MFCNNLERVSVQLKLQYQRQVGQSFNCIKQQILQDFGKVTGLQIKDHIQNTFKLINFSIQSYSSMKLIILCDFSLLLSRPIEANTNFFRKYKLLMLKVLLITILVSLTLCSVQEVFSVDNQFQVTNKVTASELGHAIFDSNDKQTGWNKLYIYTSPKATPLQQHQAAGFLQGYSTYSQIYSAFINFVRLDFGDSLYAPKVVDIFMKNQIDYMDEMVKQNPTDIFWQYIGYYLEQVRYMYAGYLTRIKKEKMPELEIEFIQFYYLTSVGDLEDLTALAGQPVQRKNCNAYVRLVQDNKLLISHATHNRYSFLLRIFKTWSFPRDNVPLQYTSFTSRPGDLISKDDFFILSSGLRVLQTSLSNYIKENIYEVKETTAPSWIRTLVANHLSSTPEEWISYFNTSRSGTHNNQWIIIDTKRQGQKKGLVYFFQEAFSLSSVFDMTASLYQKGYVAGYNAPIDKAIYLKLGLGDTKGPPYEVDYRALEFAKFHPNMSTIDGIKYFMLERSPYFWDGFAPRYDLQIPKDARPFGLTDCKIVNKETLSEGYFWAINGPSTSNGELPPFEWKNWQKFPHAGLLDSYNFTWQKISLHMTANKQQLITE